jgi:acyl-CoA synthetase (AMP-forming)/AMP-acid ligase II
MTVHGRLLPPRLRFRGSEWTPEALDATARAWWAELRGALPDPPPLVATVLPVHPEGVALFFALCALPGTAVVTLAEDPTAWRSDPALPVDAPLVLPPMLGALAAAAESRGYRAITLSTDPPAPAVDPGYEPLSFGGVVAFTSGSTGLPKPVYRATPSLIDAARVTAQALGMREGDGIIGGLPFSNTHGLGSVMATAIVIRGHVGLMDRFDHRTVLSLFASGEYRYFPCTPLMAELLGRCALSGPPPRAPEICRVSAGHLPGPVFDTFKERFGVPLRPGYGSTESGVITADFGPADRVRWASAGRALPGIDVCVGDEPSQPLPTGRVGRVWFRSSIYMDGYGFPPKLEPREERDGWWPTGDLGRLDADGYLTLTGRLDDCFKAVSGQLVNPAEIVEVLRRHPDVREAAVLPLPTANGASIAALVETANALDPGALRVHAAAALPPWARPHTLIVVPELPRNLAGKIDRARCLTLLDAERR